MRPCPIHIYDGFSRLEEIWLGAVYPDHFLYHLPTYVQDPLGQIFQWTREDLDVIQKKFEEFGVAVRRPRYHDDVTTYCYQHHDHFLFKPEITPRDKFLSYANTIVVDDNMPDMLGEHYGWKYILDEYQIHRDTRVIRDRSRLQVIGANAIRLGSDLFLDTHWDPDLSDEEKYQEFQDHIPALFPDSRCHFLNQGGHCDAGFAVLGPGRLLTTQYYEAYADCFRGWQLLNIEQPEFHSHGVGNPGNGRWWVPDLYPGPNFNNFLLQFAADWFGNYQETYFECNCVLIDECNIMCIGTNDGIFERLHQWGFNVHVVPFRTRSFWDGGLHCITLDIRRSNGPRDYFSLLNKLDNH